MAPPAAAGDKAAEMNRRILELAGEEKWQQIADVVARRDALLLRVPAAEREQALLDARACSERLQTMAQAAKSRCAEQLAAIRRGRKAAESYRAHR